MVSIHIDDDRRPNLLAHALVIALVSLAYHKHPQNHLHFPHALALANMVMNCFLRIGLRHATMAVIMV